MKKSGIVLGALALALAAAPAFAAPETKSDAKSAKKEASVSVSAVVDAIDYKTREVTLVTDKGKVTVVAGDDVKNLASVHKGDTVTVTYREGLLAEARNPTDAEKAQPYQESVTGGTGSPAKPGASIGYQVKAVTTVMAIDKAMHTITFKGPRGRVETIHAEDPKNLDKVKVGDTVVFTYSENVALSIQPAPKM